MSVVVGLLRAQARGRWRAWLGVAVVVAASVAVLANLIAVLPARWAARTSASAALRVTD